jgi:acyl-CoA thioester hydrolase
VLVVLDPATQRPTRIPDADREFLSQFGTFDPAHVLDLTAAPAPAAQG